MTNQRILELLKIERECVARGDTCGRNCASCELVQEDWELLEMYDILIKERRKMYKTKEEAETAWPLGTVVEEEPIFQCFYCADQIMFDKIKKWFHSDDVRQSSPHHATVTRMTRKTIEGYLYNGESWFPMMHEGNNWTIYYPEVF